jgi:putative oxidoreductase
MSAETATDTTPLPRSGFRRICDSLWKLTAAAAFLAPLLTRLVIGHAFFLTGSGKWENFDRTAEFFASLGIPAARANAGFVALLELVGGLCLIAGLGTRVVSFLLSSTMVVALLTADRESFVNSLGSDLTSVAPVPMLLFLIWLLLYGPGKISLDHLIFRRYRRDGAI